VNVPGGSPPPTPWLPLLPAGYALSACGQRFGDFQPDSPTLTLLSRLNVARVLSAR